MDTITIQQFYKENFKESCPDLDNILTQHVPKDIGHFNVFNIAEMYAKCKTKPEMPYNRRTYYKVSLIAGRNTVEYADKTVEIEDYGILFATPKVPYRYTPAEEQQAGHFCVFTKEFLPPSAVGIDIDQLPVFSPQSDFVFRITGTQFQQVNGLFERMHEEIGSEYAFKYNLLRNYLMELIHFGQKLTPVAGANQSRTAATRITSLFIELLERQFPIQTGTQSLQLRTPKDYAQTLGVHINHLNKVLKETMGKTTGEIIASRINQEAKMLLRQTQWNVSEIAYSLGFEEVAHFSNFFKKHSNQPPGVYRGELV